MWWWLFNSTGASGFSASSTAEQVTLGIDASALTAVVTGATSGIGVETARVLALRGVHVVMAVRNLVAAADVKAAIVREIPSAKIDAMELDLSSMDSVRKFASNYKSSGLPLNILINNAGVITGKFMLSKDNIEMDFATNHIGHFLLTDLLLETMKKTARKSKREGRIVNVSSNGHKISYRGGIRFDKINDPSGFNAMLSYCQSKLANVLHANELARRLKDDGVNITANSVHPGAVVTSIIRINNKILFELGKMIASPFTKNVHEGAATTCYVALHPQVEGISGAYFENSSLSEASDQAKDMDLGNKLWDFSINLVNK